MKPNTTTQTGSNIVCPHCQHEYGDSWEYNKCDDATLDCIACGESFRLSVEIEVTYTTVKAECHLLEKPKDHNFLLPKLETEAIRPQTAKTWNAQKFLGRSNWEAMDRWSRECSVCGYVESVRVPCGGACPWGVSP